MSRRCRFIQTQRSLRMELCQVVLDSPAAGTTEGGRRSRCQSGERGLVGYDILPEGAHLRDTPGEVARTARSSSPRSRSASGAPVRCVPGVDRGRLCRRPAAARAARRRRLCPEARAHREPPARPGRAARFRLFFANGALRSDHRRPEKTDRATLYPRASNHRERVLEALAAYPDREELRQQYPELEDADIRQALEYAAGALDDRVTDLPAA
jgi:Protein of unknown function (DUF433)